MTPKCVSFATGRIFEFVFDESVAIVDDGARLTYGAGGEIRAPHGESFVDVIDADEFDIQRYPISFEWEQMRSNGAMTLEHAGTADARHAIRNDAASEHTRSHWERLAVSAGMGIDPGDYAKKADFVAAVKAAV